jgi:hypothetical protein
MQKKANASGLSATSLFNVFTVAEARGRAERGMPGSSDMH